MGDTNCKAQQEEGVYNSNFNREQVEEDILIIGGGPIGGMMAHIFATKYNFSVRIIERYPNMTNSENTRHDDRSGGIHFSHKTNQIYDKFGLRKDINQLLNPVDKLCILIQDMKIPFPFHPQQNLTVFTVGRRKINNLFVNKNMENSKISYEFDTKVLNCDLDSKIIETENRKTGEKLTRKFKFVIGADGYNSVVRDSIDKKHGTETKLELYPFAVKNVYLPPYGQHLDQLEEVKQGKYPLYDKLDEKFKKKGLKNLHGNFVIDPATIHAYGSKNALLNLAPCGDGWVVGVICLGLNQETFKEFSKIYPEYEKQGRFSTDEEVNYNFDKYQTDEQIHEFLVQHLPALYGIMPDMVEQFKNAPIFKSYTVFCDNWYYNGDACLFGDASNGLTYMSGNGYNVSMQNIDKFFEIFEAQVQGNGERFLQDENLRQQIFSEYQNSQLKSSRACQEGDIRDAIFPSPTYAFHPKFQLYGQVEQMLYQQVPDIYNSKLNFCYFTTHNFYEGQTKGKLFQEYILKKIENVDKIQDVDISNAREELTEILKKENLPLNYTIVEGCEYN